ncbi:heat shock protein 30 [Blastomyces gilchristii SLH14081]|uniref:Heat shock protein 30 n=1 Tax=Blastomyces gilchristii (strain SLH14081) TaxID=559298 RepID=A0A179UC60_BLAGS|nr:heat shock protein 30 [Blastomyces gilchristii SLH14081]OAT05313.1 heat shock protein 30 [Blastomyces gilchristii SLH14081]
MSSRPAIIKSLKSRLPSQRYLASPAYRVSKLATTASATPYNYTTSTNKIHNHNQTRNMSFFPRFPSGEFTPLFRLLEDYETHRSGSESTSGMRTFAPRFDVRESKDAYHLDGELPGISQKDIDIEFTDSQTLVVKGRSEREYSASSGGDEHPSASGALHGPRKPRQPTVEDEEPETSTTAVTKTGGKSQAVGHHVRDGMKYWVCERSVGEFSRTFSFPSRVNQDGVKASLKNGILSVVIPKSSAPTSKRINID